MFNYFRNADSLPVLARRFEFLSLVVLFGGYCLIATFDWFDYLAVPSYTVPYSDWAAVLSAADCYQQGVDVVDLNICDPYGRKHAYPMLWTWVHFLGLGIEDLVWSGFALMLAAITALVCILRPQSPVEFGLTLALGFSPPFALAIERGNNDIIVFAGLAVAIGILSQKERWPGYLGSIVISVVTLLKIYPGAAAVALVVCNARLSRGNKHSLIAGLSFVCLYWLWNIQELFTLAQIIPVPKYGMTFGAQVGAIAILEGLGVSPDRGRIYGLIVLKVILSGVIIAMIRTKLQGILRGRVFLSHASLLSMVLGLGASLFCYLTAAHYDYRTIFMVFLMPALFDILRWRSSPGLSAFAWCAIFGVLGVMWAYYPQWLAKILLFERYGVGAALNALTMMEGGLTWGVFWTWSAMCLAFRARDRARLSAHQ